jgi:hypothetical protein
MPTSLAFSGFCWVGKCRPFWFWPLSFSHLLGPQAGRTEEQLSSTITMTAWPFGSFTQIKRRVRAVSRTPGQLEDRVPAVPVAWP